MNSDSYFQMILKEFKKHKMAVFGVFAIIFFALLAFSAPLITYLTNVSPNDQNVFNRYLPMFSSAAINNNDAEMRLEKYIKANPEVVEDIKSFQAKHPDYIWDEEVEEWPYDFLYFYGSIDEFKTTAQSSKLDGVQQLVDLEKSFYRFHILGTDELGRDVLMRLIYGARISLGVGLFVAFISAFIGYLVGIISGYLSGSLIDTLLMRFTDSLLALPQLPLLIVFAAIDITKLPLLEDLVSKDSESFVKMIIVLSLFSWMTVARLIRGSILSVKEQEYISAAKAVGSSHLRTIFQHITPNIMGPLLVAVTLNIGNSILWEAALSFLGLGIQPPTPSWGNMLFNATEIIYESPSLAILPGIFIFITVISFNFFGDGIQQALDPKS